MIKKSGNRTTTNQKLAQKIGVKLIMKYTLVGCIVAATLMSLLHGSKGLKYVFEWIPNYSPPLIFGILGLILGSYLAGNFAGKMTYNKGLWSLWGIISALLVTWSGVLAAGLYIIISECVKRQAFLGDLIEDYLIKPFFWITIVGSIPIVVLGILFGKKLHRAINAARE